MKKRIRRYFSIPFRDKLLLTEAVFYLFAAKILILILPFRRVIKTFNNKNCIEKEWDLVYLKRIRNAIRWANYLAFWDNVCLVKSIAGKWILQRRKVHSRLILGVNIDNDKKFMAHAWLKVGEFNITFNGGDYQELHEL